MENIQQFFKNLMNYVGRMTPSQVMMLFGVVAGTIVGTFFVIGWINDVSYSKLYTGLNEEEAGEIVTYLEENKIQFQLSDGGKTVEVSSSDVYKTRINLASEGLPSNGKMGYSIFDQNNLGMTDFLQKLNFRRALEGELTKTIMQLREVQAARVHISMPKERLFKDDQKKATASIMIKLRGSGTLNKRQLNGITHLVASSVEGLKPENIAIIDYDGNLLSSDQKRDELAGLSSSQLDVRKQVENYLQEKAQTMLDNVLGRDKSVVRITADLNFRQIERTSETYDPNTPSVRSEERTKTTASLSDKADENNERNDEEDSETTITNYELNKTLEHMIDAVGTIERLSVAVMVDGIYAPVENADGVIEQIYQPQTQDDLDRLAGIVKNSVGFDQQRNDQIEMVNMPFNRQNLEVDRELLDSMYMREFYMDIARKVGYVLLLIVAFLYFKKKSKKLFTALGQFVPAPLERVVTDAPVAGGSSSEAVAQPDEMSVPIVAVKRKPKLVDKMQKTAKEQPEELAKVIKTMMVD